MRIHLLHFVCRPRALQPSPAVPRAQATSPSTRHRQAKTRTSTRTRTHALRRTRAPTAFHSHPAGQPAVWSAGTRSIASLRATASTRNASQARSLSSAPPAHRLCRSHAPTLTSLEAPTTRSRLSAHTSARPSANAPPRPSANAAPPHHRSSPRHRCRVNVFRGPVFSYRPLCLTSLRRAVEAVCAQKFMPRRPRPFGSRTGNRRPTDEIQATAPSSRQKHQGNTPHRRAPQRAHV